MARLVIPANKAIMERMGGRTQPILKDRLYAVAPFVILLCLAPAFFFLPVTHDAIWQMWIGRHMLGGARLYTDIIEVNPPLWFWIAMPLAALGADPRLTIISFFFAASALSLYLTPRRFRLAMLAVVALVPLHDFGQREHFALIATIPYVFAVAGRSKEQEPRHPFAIGLFAAAGLCLKPHFLLVPVALELLVWRQKHVRPETLGLVAFGLAYSVAVLVFTPAYLTDAVPMNLRFYGAFGRAHPTYYLLSSTLFLAVAGAVAGKRLGSAESRALLVASLAFLPAVLIQNKGFAYHSVPARGLLFFAIIAEFMRVRRNPLADSLLLASAGLCCWPFWPYTNVSRPEMERHLAGIRPGTSIIVLASNPSIAWPMVAEHRLVWQLHEFSPWQINAVLRDPKLLTEVRRIVAPDLAKRPDILIMDRRPVFGPVTQELLPPGYMDCYRQRLRTAELESFQRTCQ